MKIKSTFTVVLESDDGENAEFVFKKPRANKILAIQASESKDIKDNFFMITEDLVSVKGLYEEDGKEVTKETLGNLELDMTTLMAIIHGYNQAAYPKKEEDQEKKTS